VDRLKLTRSATDRTLENQNEEEMQSLHGKIKALRSVSPVRSWCTPKGWGASKQAMRILEFVSGDMTE